MSSRAPTSIWWVFRPLLPFVPFIASFLLVEGPIHYFEWQAGQRAPLRTRPGTVILLISCVNYALFRVFAFHPIFRKGYRTWLESTPWTYRKPLPLGPVELSWRDGLVLGSLLLLSATLPEPNAMRLLCTYLLANLLAILCSFFLTRSSGFAYVTAFALGLAVLFWHQPEICLAALAGVYLIAYEGLRRALASFPWQARKLPGLNEDMSVLTLGLDGEACGWPHDRLMGEIVDGQLISRIDVVLVCMLASWWATVLISLIHDPDGRLAISGGVFGLVMFFLPFGRIARYTAGYSSPISFWGRIRTFRWIIPGYDQIFVAPFCAMMAGVATLALLHACRLPLFICLTFASGMVILVTVLTPPRLRLWRLTGQHRIVSMNGMGGQAKNLVKVR
jgi:hypothetical protein